MECRETVGRLIHSWCLNHGILTKPLASMPEGQSAKGTRFISSMEYDGQNLYYELHQGSVLLCVLQFG